MFILVNLLPFFVNSSKSKIPFITKTGTIAKILKQDNFYNKSIKPDREAKVMQLINGYQPINSSNHSYHTKYQSTNEANIYR